MITISVTSAQEDITNSVIDSALWNSHSGSMVDHDEILITLVRKIDSGEVRQVDVARLLNIAPARVAEMRLHKRRIQPAEMPVLAQFLGLSTIKQVGRPVIGSVGIPHLGKVAQGVWIEQSLADPENPEFVQYDMQHGDPTATDLFAVTPEGLSMNRLFPAGIKLICRRIPFGLADYKPGDLVIAERHSHDLRELTCKLLKVDENGEFWLHSDSDQPQFQEPWRIGMPNEDHHSDTEIGIIGKVVRGVIDYGS